MRYLLSILLVVFIIGYFNPGEAYANKYEADQLVNLHGRLVPKFMAEEFNEQRIEQRKLVRASSTDLQGDNFPITRSSGDQYPPAIAYNSIENNYLVVWYDERNANSTGADIYGQLVTPTGLSTMSNFLICGSPDDQAYVDVAYNSQDNEYLVIWFNYGDDSIHCRRVSATGELLASERYVCASADLLPSIAYNSQENMYLVACPVGDYTILVSDIYGQLLDNQGMRQGNSFSICSAVLIQDLPEAVYNSLDNEYFVVWEDIRNSISAPTFDIYGQIVSETGQRMGSNIAISPTDGYNWEGTPGVAYNGDRNEYFVVWQDDRNYPDLDIFGQILEASGRLRGESFAVCAAYGRQAFANIGYSSISKEYVVVWNDNRNDSIDVYGQRASDRGILDGGNFPISIARYWQPYPVIAHNSTDNNFMATWWDERNKDSTGWDIYAQLILSTDRTPPDPPTAVEPATHTPGQWSNIPQIIVGWEAAVDLGSGVGGYSIAWDHSSDTIPDEIKDLDGLQTTSPVLATGTDHYFHVRTVDNSGNWSVGAAHLGPFWIDTNSPALATDLASATHDTSAWNSARLVEVSWTPAHDGNGAVNGASTLSVRILQNGVESGLGGYSVLWDTFPSTLPEDTMNLEADVTEAGSPELTDGDSHYFHIRSVDVAGNWGDTAAHIGPFWIDGTAPTLVTDTESVPLTETCVAEPTVQVTWSAATDAASGLQGYSVLWDISSDTLPDETIELGNNISQATSAELADSNSHYFHIRSIDNVGNASAEAVHIGPFYINTTGPNPVADLQSTSHQTGVWSNDDTVDMQWSSAGDQCSQLDGFSIVWDDQADTVPDESVDLAGDIANVTSPALTGGNVFYLHIRGVDTLENWGETAHAGPFLIDLSKPSEVTDLASESHSLNTWNPTQIISVSWTAAQDGGSGLGGYSTLWDTSPDTLPEETMNLGNDTTQTESPALDDGNSHYFHIRSTDLAGNWCDTAVHIGPFFIDATSPTHVTDLSSASHQAEICSLDTTVQVTWVAASDESSGLLGYSILWDTFAETLPDDVVELNSNAIEDASAELADGMSHYFHIRGVDNAGNSTAEAVHIGPFYIDTTGPESIADLQSASHEIGAWSNDATIDAQWAAVSDQCSGLDGYSLIWDEQSDTLPDEVKNIEEDIVAVVSDSLTSGAEFYLHLRSVDNLGNWNNEAAHLGPFSIDITKPSEVTGLISPTHTMGEWSSANTVEVTWTPSQDGHSGLAGYSVLWDNSPDTLPDEVLNLVGDLAETESAPLVDGQDHYFHIRSVDGVGNWCDTAVHIGPFFIDSTSPAAVSNLSSPSHSIEECSLDTVVQVTWTSAVDESSGLAGYSILWDTFAETLPDDIAELDADATESSSEELLDGKEHYFHIRSIDNVGNSSDEAVHIGPFYIDTTGAELVSDLTSVSHTISIWSDDDTVDIQWATALDQCAEVDGYSILWDNQPEALPDDTKDVEGDAIAATSSALASGDDNYVHIRSVDSLGNWADEAAHLGPFLIDVTKPSEVTDMASFTHSPGSWTPLPVVKVTWTAAQDDHSGLAGYSAVWDTSPDTLPEGDMNLGAEATESESEPLADGDNHYFHIRSVDAVGNWCDTAVHIGPFYIDTQQPAISFAEIASEWSSSNIAMADVVASDELSGLQGYSVLWDNSPETDVEEAVNYEALESIEGHELGDGEWYLHARSADNAGNWSDLAHLGPFMIDATAPLEVTDPISTTHNVDAWSDIRTVAVSWNPAEDFDSGLAGYSAIWDQFADTLPDEIINMGADVVEVESEELGDGADYYLHIRSVDIAGNWCSTATHIGPFHIDADPPNAVTDLQCTSHIANEWSNNNALEFAWNPSLDLGRGLDGYAIVVDQKVATVPDTKNIDNSAESFSANGLADGEYFFHIRPLDLMGFWGDTESIGPFWVDSTPPSSLFDLRSNSHETDDWVNQSTANVSWTKIRDEKSGLEGYSYSWDSLPDDEVDVSPDKVNTSRKLADGSHAFYIKAVDNAGNWSEVAELDTFMVDTSPPDSVEIFRIAADSGDDYIHIVDKTIYYSGISSGKFTVYVAGVDRGSGLKEAAFGECVSPGGIQEAESSNSNYSYSYQYDISNNSGFNGWVDVTLYDHANNSASANFNVVYDAVGPNIPTNVTCDDGAAWNNTGEIEVKWEGEGDDGVGVTNYYAEAGNVEPTENPSSGSATISVDDGESVTIYVRGLDNVGNWGAVASAKIGVDTKAPGAAQNITHDDSDSSENFDNDRELEFSWEPASDNIKVDHYQVHLSTDSGAYKLLGEVDDEEYIVAGRDGSSYKLRVIAVDPAGNEGPDTESEEVICDESGPEFALAMLPNPGFRNFMDIVVISMEKLLEESLALSVNISGRQTINLTEITENVWVGSLVIPSGTSGNIKVEVEGTDLAGNENTDTSSFTVETVLAGAPARIQTADGNLTLDIPAGAFDGDAAIFIAPVAMNKKLMRSLGSVQMAPGLSADTVVDELTAIGDHYFVWSDDAELLKPVSIKLKYGDGTHINKRHLGIYTWNNNSSEWKYVDSIMDEESHSTGALLGNFGLFGIYSDTKAPQVFHISPSNGDVLDTSIPEFAIQLSDKGSGVDLSSLSLIIDDKMINASIKCENELVKLTPEKGLSAGVHTFYITGGDLAGNDFTSIRRNVHIPEWAVIPEVSQLLQNYPNPFNPETWIPYRLVNPARVSLSIYNSSGQLVRILELGQKKPGTYTNKEHAIYWDGRNEYGETVSSGIYYYYLSADEFFSIKKMVVVR